MIVPPLALFCIHALKDTLPSIERQVPPTPELVDALDTRDPRLWATLAQLVNPLPPHLHDYHTSLSHPALPLLQKISDSSLFSLLTLLSLPNCTQLRDDDVANFRTLHRLHALDLRGCSISSYALTALARGLATSSIDSRSGPWGIRLLSLHGCPNIDNDALDALLRFPLLSAIDLRFTRCTPNAVNTLLSPLGFRPSDNNSLFHPAPLSLAFCSLEKVALTASDPISLYSCPPHSVFRLHIDQLNHLPLQPKKGVPTTSSSTTTIRTISSAEDTVVFIPPLPKQTKGPSCPPSKPSVSSTVPAVPTPPPTDQPISNVSSFYRNAPPSNKHSRKNILPLSAQAIQSSEGGKLDPLAIARLPPPWKTLDAHNSPILANPPAVAESLRRTQPIVVHSLNNFLKVDRTRLHKRNSDAVADMVHQFSNKRPKIESEFALAKTRAKAAVKSRNPFTKCARSVFAESSSINACDRPRPPVHEPPKEVEPDVKLRTYRSLPTKMVEGISKPLKPITSIKPPILPKELLPPLPQHAAKPRTEMKQTRLTFAREVE